MGRKSRAKSERPAAVAPPPVAEPRQDLRLLAAIGAALIVLVAIVFAQLRTHDFLNYDDPIYVTDNATVQRGLTAGGIAWAFTSFDFNWHPLTWLTHMIDVELFGLNAGAHLVVNAVIHAINAILVLLIFSRATGSIWRSAIVAALFAIHPLHVESVAWLSERKDVLSSLFLLLTIFFYLKFVGSRSRAFYAAMIVAFVFGLMSKGMLVTLPFVLLLIDYWPLHRFELGDWRRLRELFVEKLPLFALILPAIWVTWYAQHAVEAIAAANFVPLPIRLANAVISYVVYLRKTFWPNDLALGYPYPSTIKPSTAILCAIVLLGITAAVLVFRNRRYLFTGWFWFAGMLVPVSGIVQIGPQSMADRYTYIPLIGVFAALVWLVADLVGRREAARMAATAISVGLIAGLTFAARAQTSHWRSTETLFARSVAVTKRNPIAHETLAFAYFRNKEFDKAIVEFNALIALRPQYARGYEGLGAALLAVGRTAEATDAYRTAVRLNPESAEAQRQLGNLAMAAGNKEEAAALLEKAAALGDRGAEGALALARGDEDAAIRQYEAAVSADPKSAEALNNLAAALARKGRNDEALQQYRAALRLAPFHYDANMNLGALLSRTGRGDEALSHFVAATRSRPQSTEPYVYMGLLLAQSGRVDAAVIELEKAMKINPQTANTELTNALRMPPSPTNLQEFVAALKSPQ